MISVVMSVYKEPIEWLRLAIDSILQQTFADFEFIIICDNPQYNEGISLLKEYQEKDSRIIIIQNEENIGLTKSLNKGLAIAKGEYIARMDADDISMKNRFAIQINYLKNNPNIVACGTFIKVINENGEEVEKRSLSTEPQEIRDRLVFASPIVHPASMFKRVVNGSSVTYNEERRYSQDYALWVSLAANYDLANVPEYLLCYRESNVQISSKNHHAQQNCARLNSEAAIKALNLKLSEGDKYVIYVLTRADDIKISISDIENSICSIYKNNKNNPKVNIKHFIRELILIICNYLPRYYPITKSLSNYLKVSKETHCFSAYSLLSMLNKYRRLFINL